MERKISKIEELLKVKDGKKVRVDLTIDKELVLVMRKIKRQHGVSMSQVVEQQLRKTMGTDKERIRNEIRDYKKKVAALMDEWTRLFPEEDLFPDGV